MDLVRKLALVTTAFVTICVLTTCRLRWLCLDDLLISHRGLYLPPAQNFLLKASQFPGIVDVVVAAICRPRCGVTVCQRDEGRRSGHFCQFLHRLSSSHSQCYIPGTFDLYYSWFSLIRSGERTEI